MLDNLLPTEANHSICFLDLFQKPSVLVTFDESCCQKLDSVYGHNGPMLEFEVAGDRNYFTDLQKVFFEVKCKIDQSYEAHLKYDCAAAADVTKLTLHYFAMCSIPCFLTVQCQPTDLKYPMQMEITLTKVLLTQSFHITKTQKTGGWLVKFTRMRKTQNPYQLLK